MRTRRQFIQSLLMLPVAVLVACRQSPKFDKLPKGALVVALGDSLTFGYGVDKGQAYPDVLADLTGWQIDNAGINGDTTENVLNRLDGIVVKKPKLVLLGIGGNDVLRRVDSNITKQNLINIIQKLYDTKIAVVLIAQPHLSASALFGRVDDNPVYQEVADITGVPLFADGWSQILSDKTLKSDQIHANHAGYAKFAQLLYAYLQTIGYA